MPFMHQRPIKVIDLDEVRSVSGDEGDVAEKPVKLVKLASQQHPNDDTGQDDCGEQGGGDQSIGGDQVAEVDPVDQGDQQDRQDQGVQQEEPVVDGHHEEASVKGGDADDSSDDSDGDTESEEDGYDGTSTDESVTDDSEDDTDEESDSSTDESAHSRRTTTKLKYEEKPKQQQDKDETVQFDFEEVIDDASKTPQSGHIEDEDIGGEVVTAATTIAGASAVSCFHAKRSLLVGIAVAVLVACALYYIWRKFEDMKNKLLQLQQQQEMSLNDRDVQVISSQVLQDYLREEDAKEDMSDYNTSGTDTSADNDALQTIEETSEESSECLEDLTDRSAHISYMEPLPSAHVTAKEPPPSANEPPPSANDPPPSSVHVAAKEPPPSVHVPASEPPPAVHVPVNDPPPAAHVPEVDEKKPPPAACPPDTSEALENRSPDDGEAVEKRAMGDTATPTDGADPGEDEATANEEPTSDSLASVLQDENPDANQGLETPENNLQDDKPRRRSRRVKT